MRSTFWPNLIFERQISQIRETGLKFSSKRKNSALFMKMVQNALFRSCTARFGQIAFWSVKVFKLVTREWNSLRNEKTVRLPWKLYKTLFSGHAQHFLAKSHFWASKFSKSWNWPEILFKREKQCAFEENCTKPAFQVVFTKSDFWAPKFSKSWNWPQILAKTGKQCAFQVMRFSWKQKNGAQFRASKFLKSSHWPEILFKSGKQCVFYEIVQNALFRSCAARFCQIAFLSVKVLKIVKLASNSLQSGKTVRFLGHAHFFKTEKRCAFLSVKVRKIVTLAWNSL